jgi:hypothetical protein
MLAGARYSVSVDAVWQLSRRSEGTVVVTNFGDFLRIDQNQVSAG